MSNFQGGSPKISNLILENSNTPYLFYFDKWCKKFIVKTRNRQAVTVTTDVNDVNYLTLSKGSVWCEDFILCPLTLYFKSQENNVVVEILEWISKD